jgi:lysophospholipase L1-like esterase
VLALIAGEIFVRVCGLGGTTLSRGRLHSYDADAGWICRPGLDVRYAQPSSFDVAVRTNARGLRDRELAFEKPSGIRRIAVVGDSCVWGYGVETEEMISSRLEQLLPATETINLGANGYSTVQELVRLETEGLRYAPDWVVLGFCWNDLEDNFDDKDGGRPVVRVDADGSIEIVNRPVRRPWKSPGQQWLRHNSRLFNFGEYCLSLLKFRLAGRRSAAALEAEDPSPSEDEYDTSAVAVTVTVTKARAAGGPVDQDDLQLTLVDLYSGASPALDLAWEAARALIARTAALARENGSRMIVFNVASLEEADPDVFRRWAGDVGLDPVVHGLSADRPSERIAEMCASVDVPFVDLVPAFRAAEDAASLYLRKNSHWSAAGHRLAASEVAAAIEAIEAIDAVEAIKVIEAFDGN